LSHGKVGKTLFLKFEHHDFTIGGDSNSKILRDHSLTSELKDPTIGINQKNKKS
jgi:hypothetical protein